MHVGYLQFAPSFHDPQNSFSRIEELLNRRGEACDLIVLPELSLSGYLFKDRDELRPIADEIRDIWMGKMAELAREQDCSIVYGYPESTDTGLVYNSSCLVQPDGTAHTYRKVHLYGFERDVFTSGDTRFEVQSLDELPESPKVSMLICFDHMFPEPARTLSLKGTQIICHPSNLVMPTYAQINSRSYALTNRIFWILANRIGKETLDDGRSCTFTGRSQIVAPDGEVLVCSRADVEECRIIQIDPCEADDKGLSSGNDLFDERRPEFYH